MASVMNDDELVGAARALAFDWPRVAASLGSGGTADECRARYARLVGGGTLSTSAEPDPELELDLDLDALLSGDEKLPPPPPPPLPPPPPPPPVAALAPPTTSRAAAAESAAVRRERQVALFDRLLESLGGPVDAEASANIPIPQARPSLADALALEAADAGGGKLRQREHELLVAEQAREERLQRQAEAEGDAAAEALTASFVAAAALPAPAASSGLDGLAGLAGVPLASAADLRALLHASGLSDFGPATSVGEASAAAWDLVLADVELPDPFAVGAFEGAFAGGAVSGAGAPAETTELAEVLQFLGREPKWRVPPLSVPYQQRHPLPFAEAKPLPSLSSASRELADGGSRGRSAALDRYGRARDEAAAEEEEGEEVEGDLRAQRALLKARAAAVLPHAPPRPLALASDETDLLRLLDAGRAAAARDQLVRERGDVRDEDGAAFDSESGGSGVRGLDETLFLREIAAASADATAAATAQLSPAQYYRPVRRVGGGGDAALSTSLAPAPPPPQVVAVAGVALNAGASADGDVPEDTGFTTLVRQRGVASVAPPPLPTREVLEQDEARAAMPTNLPWSAGARASVTAAPKATRAPRNEASLLVSSALRN